MYVYNVSEEWGYNQREVMWESPGMHNIWSNRYRQGEAIGTQIRKNKFFCLVVIQVA
jgi:hypothetical protein